MNINEIVKPGIIGGVAAIVIQFVVRSVAPSSIAYDFGFITMILGGAIAGWMIKGKQEDAVAAGVLASLIYVVLGVLVIFPMLSGHQFNAIVAIVVGVVLGAVGGFAGQYLAHGSARPSGKRK